MSKPIVSVKRRPKNSAVKKPSVPKSWPVLETIQSRWFNSPRKKLVGSTILAALIYGLITFIYIHPALTACNTSILSPGPGDSTAGLTWTTWLDKHSPVPGFTHLSNAPYGESLRQPFQITSLFTIPSMWILAKMTSAICAWNLLVYFGYMSSALLMFAFIRWLTRSSLVAFLAGFAVTYTPYHQMNSLGHISYMFSGFFVLIIWAFINLWRRPTFRNALLLAVASGFCFYIDGYFILLTLVLISSLVVAGLLSFKFYKMPADMVLARLKALSVSFLFLVLLLLPIAFVQFRYSATINSVLSSSRDSISAESQTYSARPYEYFLPADNNPLLPHSFSIFRVRHIHGSNFTESTLYLGTAVLLIAAYAYYAAFRKKVVISFRGIDMRYLLALLSVPLVIAFMLSLEPKAVLFHHRIPMPSWFVTHITQMWRVFSRLFLIVDTSLVIIAATGFYLLIRRAGYARQLVFTTLAVAIVAADFLTRSSGAVWSFKGAPGTYAWMATQSNIHEIAEYPLGDPPSQESSNYFTYQQIDGKARINTTQSNSPQRPLHMSIAGLADAQTIPVLRGLGVDTVLSHNNPVSSADLQLLRQDSTKRHDYTFDQVWTYRLLPGTKADYVVILASGFHAPMADTNGHSRVGMGSHGVLNLQGLAKSSANNVHVTLSADPVGPPSLVTFAQNGVVRWQGQVNQGTSVSFDADPDIAVDVIPYHPTGVETIQIYNMEAHL